MSYRHDSETSRNAGTAERRSIGHSMPTSHFAGRYVLGDSNKFLYESTTSINRWRMIRVISMKVSKGLEFPVVALPGVGAYACER